MEYWKHGMMGERDKSDWPDWASPNLPTVIEQVVVMEIRKSLLSSIPAFQHSIIPSLQHSSIAWDASVFAVDSIAEFRHAPPHQQAMESAGNRPRWLMTPT